MLIVTTIVLLFLFGWVGYRIAPESSPVARGAVYAEFSSCGGCYSDPNNLHVNEIGQECITIDETAWYSDKSNECADIRAYFESVRLRRNFEDRVKNNINNPLIAGEQLARKYYCFQCHGQLGQGGFNNAKSLKGYVPGYFGNDFKILTRNGDPDSVREWIMQGVDPKILENPVIGRIAEFFFKREAINMPSYKSLDPEEIEILVNYVIALNEFGPMTAEDVRLYGEL
jgi:mono/diheme cytochrome c family protein